MRLPSLNLRSSSLWEVATSERPARILTMEKFNIQECLILRKQGKLEGDLYPVELIPDVFFCLQVDGPITGGGLVSGWAQYH